MTSSAAELRPVTLVAIGAVERALELARRRVGAADITAKEGRDSDKHVDLRLRPDRLGSRDGLITKRPAHVVALLTRQEQ
jgi:hypothetical protein